MDNPFDITETAEYQLGRLEVRISAALAFLKSWEPNDNGICVIRNHLIVILSGCQQEPTGESSGASILTGDETLPQSDAQ